MPQGYLTPNPIQNVASVSSGTTDPNLDNNTDDATTSVMTEADIAVTKSVSPETVLVGDMVTFTITAANNGPNAASGVVVTDLLPAGLALNNASASQGGYVASSGQWILGNLANGASAQLTLTAQVTVPGTITNIATKTAANEPDPNTSNDTASATVNDGVLADVGLLKTVDNPTPAVGDVVTFTVTATNNGPVTATGVVVTDVAVPGGLTFVPPAITTQGTYDFGTGQWTVGDLAVGASATLTLAAQVGQAGAIVNTVTKTQVEIDPNPANDRASVTLNGTGTADVAVAKAISDEMPAVGEPVTFLVTVTNLGPETAASVVVSDTLPTNLTFISAAPPSLGTFDPATNQWTIPSLLPSQSAVLSITAMPNQPGMFTNTATRTSSATPDPNPTNDSGSATGAAGLVADLSITKTDNLDTALAGQNITYVIVVANAGPSPVSGARVVDTFPTILTGVTWTCVAVPGSRCVAAQPDQGSNGQTTSGQGAIDLAVDFLPAGGSMTFTATGLLSPSATQITNVLSNTGTVDPPAGVMDPNLANNTATDTTDITQQANLVIEKTGPATATSGDQLVYTLTVRNAGPSTATNVVVDDPTPAGLSFVSTLGACTQGFPCQLGTLLPGDVRVTTATYDILPGDGSPRTVVDTATVSSPVPDPNPENNTSSVTTTISASAHLKVVKSAPATTAVGGTLVYTILVTNSGPDAAASVLLTDPVPAGVTLLSATTSQGTCTPGAVVTCMLGTVAAGGAGVTVTITVAVPTTAPDTIVNTATGSSTTPNPNPGNTTSTATVTVRRDADLFLKKTAAPDMIAVGETITWTIVATNMGPAPATGVTLTDPIPSAVKSPAVSATQGSCTLAGGVVTCALGDLAVNAMATVTITATRESQQAFSNTATVTAMQPDNDPGNNQSTATTGAATPEICDNCKDDDGDGLVDGADPDCCTETGTLTITKLKIRPQGGNTGDARLRITGRLEGADFSSVDPRQEAVSIRLADGTVVGACCTIEQEHWMKLFRRHFGFWDQLARICPPIADIRLNRTNSGAGISITAPHFDLSQLSGPELTVTVRVGGSCATGTATLRRTKSRSAILR